MTGLVRKATLILSVCGLLASSVAFASVPDPANSSFNKANLNFSGHDGAGTADWFSPFTVEVRDLANNVIVGSIVTLDFSLCDDIVFCEDQLDAAVTADCVTRTIRKATDGAGQVTFYLVGGATIDYIGNFDGQDCNCVKVYADGNNIVEAIDEPVNAGTYDLDNDGGVIGSDLSLWLDDSGNPGGAPLGYLRSDFDHSNADCITGGYVDGADLSVWLDASGAGGTGGSCNALAGPPANCTP